MPRKQKIQTDCLADVPQPKPKTPKVKKVADPTKPKKVISESHLEKLREGRKKYLERKKAEKENGLKTKEKKTRKSECECSSCSE